jgi:predicted PurR-regulated permease PerM
MAGDAVYNWWQATLGQPHGLAHLLQDGSVGRMQSASEVLKRVGSGTLHRLIDVAFAFLCLFFFYKDGQALQGQTDAIGAHLIGAQRWTLYALKVPTAVRATVNGLVLVGLAEGVLLGIGYQFAGVPSAVLWAAATGVLAIIPFGAPLAFGAVAFLLLYQGNTMGAPPSSPGVRWCCSWPTTSCARPSSATPPSCPSWPSCWASWAGSRPWA